MRLMHFYQPVKNVSSSGVSRSRSGHGKLDKKGRKSKQFDTNDDVSMEIREGPTLTRDETPCMFHEDFIHRGYRRPIDYVDCVRGCFRWHNETLNIWTHLIGAVFAAWRLVNLIWDVERKKVLAEDEEEAEYIGRLYFPLLAFGFAIWLVAVTSSLAHCFHTVSPRSHHICFMFDYLSIGVCFICSATAHFYYSRPALLNHLQFWFSYPLTYITATTVVNIFVFLAMAYFRCHLKGGVRTVFIPIAATACYFFCNWPFTARFLYCHSEDSCESIFQTSMYHHSYQTVLTLCSAIFMATRVPERIAPGVFDIIGHSHQLMHITVFTSAWFGWTAVQIDVNARYSELYNSDIHPEYRHSIIPLSIYFITAIAGILIYSRKLNKDGKWKCD